MLWVILALSAYFLLAIVELIDKKILSLPILASSAGPLTYAFYASLLVSAAFILWPLDFAFLPLLIILFAFLGGATFFWAIYFLYGAIIKGEISRVIAIVGGISPILIFIFSLLFLGEQLNTSFLIALLMLISGSILLSFIKDGERFKFGKHFFLHSFLAAFFFALSYGFTKAVFLNSTFLNGFIWIRTGTLFCVLIVFLIPAWRQIVLRGAQGFTKNVTILFVSNKVISAIAHVVLNYAIMLGSVAIVNALQAVEYAFIFVLTLGLSYFLPRVFYESFSFKVLVPKMIGIALVSFGVILLFLGRA